MLAVCLHPISTNCIRITKPVSSLGRLFGDLRESVKRSELSGVDGPIVRRYLDGVEIVSLRIEMRFRVILEIRRFQVNGSICPSDLEGAFRRLELDVHSQQGE